MRALTGAGVRSGPSPRLLTGGNFDVRALSGLGHGGVYAETFALWQVGGGLFFGTLAPPPTPEQLARLVVLFGGAG